MFEAGVQMVLQAQSHYYLEVSMVNMRINSEQAFEYCFYCRLKVLGEWNTYIIIAVPIWHGNSD